MPNEALEKRLAMKAKYRGVLSGKITTAQLLAIKDKGKVETPDFCALCQIEIDISLDDHLRAVHNCTVGGLLSNQCEIENNYLLVKMLDIDI